MRGKKLLATLAVSAVLFAGCGLKSGETIIKVNNTNITQGEFDKVMDKQAGNSSLKTLGVDLKNDKTNFLYLLMKDRIVNELIIKALLDEEIAKRGIEVSKDEIDDAVTDIISKVGSKQKLSEILKQNGIAEAQFRDDLQNEIKMKKLAKQLGSSTVSDAEAKTFYTKNIKEFSAPDRVRASHILISMNPEEIEEMLRADIKNKNLNETELKAKVDQELKAREEKINRILAEVKKDPSQFAKLAKENSEDRVSGEKGGDLGFFAAKEMVPEFSNAAFSMKPNTISDKPVKTQYGYHIIMVTDRSAAGVTPFEKAKENIKGYLENQKQIEAIDKLTESLKKNATIEFVNPEYDPKNVQKEVQESMKNSTHTQKPEK